MHVNMQMLGYNYTGEHSNIAVCTCRKNPCEYITYKSRLQHVYCVGDPNTISSTAVSSMIFQNGGKLLVEL